MSGAGGTRATRRLKTAVALFSLVGIAALDATRSTAGQGASVQAVLEDDGTGTMVANSRTNPPDETWSWEVCAADLSSCSAFPGARVAKTGAAAAEVKFRATSSLGETAVSPLWRGNAAAVEPPRVSGRLRANALVTPIPGEWTGGWAGGEHFAQLAACANRAGTKCVTLTHLLYEKGCPDGAAVIDPAFAGAYLRVADRLVGPDPVIAGVGLGSPYTADVEPAGPTVSVATVGRIGPAVRRRKGSCGPAEHKPVKITRQAVAVAQCLLPCAVDITAEDDFDTLERTRRLRALKRVELAFKPRQLAVFDDRFTLTAEVDGEPVAEREFSLDRLGD